MLHTMPCILHVCLDHSDGAGDNCSNGACNSSSSEGIPAGELHCSCIDQAYMPHRRALDKTLSEARHC